MVDQDPAHRLRGDSEEVGAILLGDGLAADEPKVELSDDGIRFERVIPALPLQEPRGQLAQVGLDDGEEVVTSLVVAGTPAAQPSCDFGHWRNLGHGKGARGMILTSAVVRYLLQDGLGASRDA